MMNVKTLRGVLWCSVILCGCDANTVSETPVEIATVEVPSDSMHLIQIPESVTDVTDLVVDGEGSIWILNSTDPFFVKLSREGDVLHEWGRRGGGPGEFRAPTALVLAGSKQEVWVFDRAKLALFAIHSGAAGLRTIRLGQDALPWTPLSFDDLGIGGTRLWLAHAEHSFLIAGSSLDATPAPQPLAHYNARLYRIDERSGSVTIALSIRDAVGDPVAAGIPARILMPNPLWATCADGAIAIYDPLTRTIRRFSAVGASESSISVRAGQPVEVTLDRIFGAIWVQERENKRPEFRQDSAAMYRQFVKESEEIQDQLATHFPEFIGLHCTGHDTFWLQRLSVTAGRMGRGPDWLMLRSDGRMSEVKLPSHFRPYRFDTDRVWGVTRDQWDVPSVAWIRLPS
jgi:hypothetical protein